MIEHTEFNRLIVSESATVKDALKQMALGAEKILFVVDPTQRLLGTLSDGDIRRWILSEGSLASSISKVFNKRPRALSVGYNLSDVRKMMAKEKLQVLPVINEDGIFIKALFWNDICSGESEPEKPELKVPVLIMAGGKGTRLDPFTKIFPKPLIPIGDKPIIELIIDRFTKFGCDEFFLSVSYKGKMIESYFENLKCSYRVKFVWEEDPTGTAGSIRSVAENINSSDLFVSNCDILIEADYSDIYDFHLHHDNDITIVGSVQHLKVPYGVLNIEKGGLLENIIEKPEYDFLVNTGFYIVKKSVVKHIPRNQSFDFPQLIAEVKNSGGRVRVYPVGQESWTDIGQWPEYKNALCRLEP